MGIGDRIRDWIEYAAGWWGDRLGDFFVRAISRGMTGFAEDMEPGAIGGYRETLQKLRDNPDTPPDLIEFIDRATTPGNPILVIVGGALFLLSMLGTLSALTAPLNRAIEYKVDRGVESFRMDPMSIITAWRRDKEKYARLFDDLEEQGWSDDRIEALKFLTLFYPPPADLIRWQAREVFEPDMVLKYGLDDELENIEKEPFYKAGMDDEQIRNYWRAHWEHASWIQVVEMLRRGLMTEDDVWEWFRVVEIPPFWRDKLIGISWEVPTRVDVRRFWEYGTIDEARLREIYSAQGYHGKDLDDYVLWTKVYTAFPDLLARWKNGWITLDDLRAELIRSGMTADKADELIQTKVKAVEPTSTAEGKELTKSEIYKGVKKEAITFDQGVELLMDLDYTYDQAEYLLAINTEVLAGSPESFADFKRLTGMYRKTAETKGEAMPEELQKLADQVVELTGDLDNIRKQLDIKEADIVDEEALPAEARDELNALRTTLLRTGAELERVKAEYQRQLSLWRQRSTE